jgi:hypothetical protein
VGTDAVVDRTDRERILQSLIHSMSVIDVYSVDQNHYLEKHLKARELEQDGRYFWIFRNLDYKKWFDFEADVEVLVLCGSPILEHAASYVIQTLRNTGGQANDLLYFFYGSMRHTKR